MIANTWKGFKNFQYNVDSNGKLALKLDYNFISLNVKHCC